MRGEEEEEEDADSILFILLSAYTIPTDHFFSLWLRSARSVIRCCPSSEDPDGGLEKEKNEICLHLALFFFVMRVLSRLGGIAF